MFNLFKPTLIFFLSLKAYEFSKMFLSLLCLVFLAVARCGETVKRFVADSNDLTFEQRITALETKVTALESENGTTPFVLVDNTYPVIKKLTKLLQK